MKIVVTGSLGHISKPLTQELVQKGHKVTVISSKADRQKDIEALGAAAAIGTLDDADFIAATFTGADAVYTMVPPGNYFDHEFDLMAHYHKTGNNYAQAIRKSGVKRVVHLSSIGAHLEKGSGLILGHRDIEIILTGLSNIAITIMRPSGFYYNLYSFAGMIKKEGVIAANYGAEEMLVWVSPKDIAAAVAEELETPASGKKIRYVASDELTGNETAAILGEAIGKPDLKWMLISDDEMKTGLVAAGMNPNIASGLTEMFSSQHSGKLSEDFYRNRPAVMGKVKIRDFAQEFAGAFK
ncbi:MAG: NAD(P)H-binding protein [Bacteroidota bacterium]|nr:NAD(P)H-binding protein [Bacteroidota bacterium]